MIGTERTRDVGRVGAGVGVADGIGVRVDVDVRVGVAVGVRVGALVRAIVKVGVGAGVGLATRNSILRVRSRGPRAVTYAYVIARPRTTITAAAMQTCLLRCIHSCIYSISMW